MDKDPYLVDDFSLKSLYLTIHANGNYLSNATGFIVKKRDQYFLVTNLHVITGRDNETKKILNSSCAIPDIISIFHHSSVSTYGHGAWSIRKERIYNSEGNPRWLEHPRTCIKNVDMLEEPNIDIAVLPLENAENIEIYIYDIEELSNILLPPGLSVSIIGYPFGRTSAALYPIWKTGHIASDIESHIEERHFLIDATTREGMSGSPVVYRAFGSYQAKNGATINFRGVNTYFLGIYSGRIQKDIEIGIVWRPKLINEIIDLYNEQFSK